MELTELAKSKIKEISETEGIGHCIVRVKVMGGGCAGMMNDMSFDNIIKDTDQVIESDGVTIIIDPVSFQYMQNTVIDWENNFMSSGFKFNNPDITGSCGCGKSVSY